MFAFSVFFEMLTSLTWLSFSPTLDASRHVTTVLVFAACSGVFTELSVCVMLIANVLQQTVFIVSGVWTAQSCKYFTP